METVVNVIIHPDGRVEIDVVGVEGPACEELVRKLLRELGIDEDEKEKKVELRRKPEFYRAVSSRPLRTVRGGEG